MSQMIDGLFRVIEEYIDKLPIRAEKLINKIPGAALPPTGNTGNGYTPNPDAVTRIDVRKNSAGSVFSRRRLNFIEGSNVTLTVADDSGSEEVDITIAASGGGGGSALTIEEVDGSPTVSATALKFPNGTLGVVGTVATYTPAASGSGGLTLIQEQVLGANAATVTFSSIPNTYRHLRLVCMGRITQVANDDYVYIRFNSDSGSNYDEERGVNGSFGNAFGQTKARLTEWPGTTGPADVAGTFELLIPYYANTTWQKTCRMHGAVKTGSSTLIVRDHLIHWKDTSAITSITLLPASDNFLTGSIFSLYGME